MKNQYSPQYQSTTTGEWHNFTDTKPVTIEADESYTASIELRKKLKAMRTKVLKCSGKVLSNKVRLVNGDFVKEVTL